MQVSNEIQKALITIHEMMKDRGIEFDNLLSDKVNNHEPIFHYSHSSQKEKMHVVFFLNGKGWKEVTGYLEDNDLELADYYLIVVNDPTHLKKNKDALENFQTFTLEELQFNISTHELTPKHELITNEVEINHIMNLYQLKTKTQMPQIVKTDPMSRYFNAKAGQMMKVTRISPTCGESIVYRCVV